MNEERHAVKVTIFGSEYVIRGEADEEYIQSLAHTVDERMKEIAQSTNLNSSLKISILAAINMADEIGRLRRMILDKNKDYKAHEIEEMTVAPEALSALTAHIQAALDEE